MGPKMDVTLDEELQIIRQTIEGDLDLQGFYRLDALTHQCVERLRDPGRVRILVDGREFGLGNVPARRAMLKTVFRPSLQRVAIVEATAVGRVMLRFVDIASGVRGKIRGFATEEEALEWLLR